MLFWSFLYSDLSPGLGLEKNISKKYKLNFWENIYLKMSFFPILELIFIILINYLAIKCQPNHQTMVCHG